MGTILALAAAVLYGSADFLGGAAARRARPLAVLAITTPAGAVITVVVGGGRPARPGSAAMGLPGAAGLAWGAAAGAAGTAGLLMFYVGFSVAPMSVVAPISALASALLPLGVAIAQGERPGPLVIAGGVICLRRRGPGQPGAQERDGARRAARLRGLGYGLASGIMFGLFFLFFRSAGASGVLWPVAVARLAGTTIAFGACLVAWVRPRMARVAARRAAAGARLRDGRRVRQRLLRPRDPDRPVRDRGRDHRAVPGDDRAPGAVRARRENALAAADRAGSRRGRPGPCHGLTTIRDRAARTRAAGWISPVIRPHEPRGREDNGTS